jgi:hypothetical protein
MHTATIRSCVCLAALLFLAAPVNGFAAPKKIAAPAPAPKKVTPGKNTGVLEIASMTPGAQVFIDGAQKGTIPFESIELKPGNYRLMVKKLGHLEYKATVTITAGKITAQNVDLLPSAGVLAAKSSTPGARLFVDGKPQGVLPQTIEVTVGLHKIEVRADGFLPYKADLKVVNPGQELTVDAKLAPDKLAAAPAVVGKGAQPAKGKSAPADVPALDLEPLPGADLPLEPPPSAPPKTGAAAPAGGGGLDALPLEPLALEPVAPPPPKQNQPAGAGGQGATPSVKVLTAAPTGKTAVGVAGPVQGVVAGPTNDDDVWYKQWWVWAIAGGVVVAVTATSVGVVAAKNAGNSGPTYDAVWQLKF